MARTKGSDDLFRLIHSLSPEEKTYFKKFAKRHSDGDNKYLQLFDEINSQQNFEEAGLKKKYKGFADMKLYLMDIVLDSLLLAEFNTTEINKLYKQFMHVKILNKKGLTAKAIQLNRKVIQQANTLEIFWIEEIALKWMMNFEKFGWKLNEDNEMAARVFDGLRALRAKQMQIEAYHELQHALTHLNDHQRYAGDVPKDFEKHLPMPVFGKRINLSVAAARLEPIVQHIYAFIMNDKAMIFKLARDIYKYEKKLWEDKHTLRNYDKRIKSVRRYLVSCFATHKLQLILALADEMLTIKSIDTPENVQNETLHFMYYQYWYWHTGKHNKGREYTTNNFPLRLLLQYGSIQRLNHIECYRYKVLFEFSTRDYKRVFTSISELEALDIKKSAQTTYRGCEILKVLIQAELSAYDILPQMATGTIKLLKRYGLTKPEETVLSLLKKMNTTNRRQVLNAIQHKLANAAEELQLFDVLNLKDWVQAQLSNRPLAEIVKR